MIFKGTRYFWQKLREFSHTAGHCDPPKIPNGAVVPVQHTYQIGATVEVVCSGGFVLQEENRLHCTDDGTWATTSGYAAILECEGM